MDLVLVGECFVTPIKTTSGKHTKLCMKESNHQRIKYEKKAETTKMDHLVSIDEKQTYLELPLCISRDLQAEVFVLRYFTITRTLIFCSK